MSVLKTIFRLLTFKITREELLELNHKHLFVGIAGTWIVGMGRYWDDPGAKLLQHIGLGSVIYIFLLAFIIWVIIKPYYVEKWSYFTILTFISLTSFPAIFYAIPVEMFLNMDFSATVNAWFLLIVASWRLCLLYSFLRKFTKLGHGYIVVATLLPICVIIVTLTILNLERAVFDIMGGIRENSSKDKAYGVLVFLTVLSSLAVIPLFIGYIFAVLNRWELSKQNKK